MSDISRRKFLKGTGKTILTGAVVGTVGVSGGTTTPLKTVAPKATTWKNLNVLSPKAKAYRSFLRSVKSWSAIASLKSSPPSTLSGMFEAGQADSKKRFKSVLATAETKKVNKLLGEVKNKAPQLEGYFKENLSKKSLARTAFESAIEKPKSTSSQVNKVLKPLRTFSTSELGDRIFGQHKSLTKKGRKLKSDVKYLLYHKARQEHADELRKLRKIKSHLPDKEQLRVSKKSRKGGKGIGGGIFIEGQETPRNPTGMSLITRRSILM